MLKRICYILVMLIMLWSTALSQSSVPLKEVPFTAVHLTDRFWAPRIEVNRTVSIPSAFHQCEINGRFDNFAIAGGLKEGEHRGDFPFDDTDPYKIIEGASYSLAVKYDAHLDAYLDSVIDIIAAAQEADGYLTTCVTNRCTRLSGWWGTHRWDKINSHELYNSGHLYEAAVAHFQSTGKRSLLNVAIRNADLVCRTFGPGKEQIHRPSGHPIVEMGLCKLYKTTGNRNYLNMARYFVEETGRGTDGHKLSEYSQDHKPILQQDEIVGHAVRAGYLYSGVADVAALTGDTAYFQALCRIWENLTTKKLYITGGIGSRAQGEGFGPNYELHNMNAYAETCAAIANVYWNQRMFLATGDSKYVDVLERALYNGVISGVSLSGDKFFYDNPLESLGQHARAPWFGCACCPGNITRFMASVPKYIYAVRGNELFVNLYIAGQSQISIANDLIDLTQATDYPWDGKILLTMKTSKSARFNLRLRLPAWATDTPIPGSDLYSFIKKTKTSYKLSLNGHKVKFVIRDGYLCIDRDWKNGDKVELSLPMDVRRVKANDNVAADRGLLAFERGPVMYCMEGVDNADKHVFNKYIPLNAKFTAHYNDNLLSGIVELSGTGHEIQHGANGVTTEKDMSVKLIPYSTWCNRGSDEMAVWIPTASQYAKATPEPTIASKAKAFMVNSYNAKDGVSNEHLDECYGINDQWDPKNSADMTKPYCYFWLKKGSSECLEYEFEQPSLVSSAEVYWLDFDHYDGNYSVPQNWKIQYKHDGQWKDVENTTPYTCKKDTYNKVGFKSVTTEGLRLCIDLQKGESGGVIEWKVE